MTIQDFDDGCRVFNPEFVRKVWAKRRAGTPREKIVAKVEQRARPEFATRSQLEWEIRDAIQDVPRVGHSPSEKVIRAVAAKHDIPPEAIVGPRRFAWLMPIRAEAVEAVANGFPDLSLPQIARIFGGRDHSSIVNLLKKRGVMSRPRPTVAA